MHGTFITGVSCRQLDSQGELCAIETLSSFITRDLDRSYKYADAGKNLQLKAGFGRNPIRIRTKIGFFIRSDRILSDRAMQRSWHGRDMTRMRQKNLTIRAECPEIFSKALLNPERTFLGLRLLVEGFQIVRVCVCSFTAHLVITVK